MRSTTTHPCDICPALIGRSFLMCPKHWRLVPKELQTEVYRTWGRVTRSAAPHDKLQRIAAYRKAREAAVSAARAACETTTGEDE